MSEDCELLFFDTFSHDACELNLDLVQFPNPVYIFEIRVIPLGARVQADFPGGHRLGATNPSSFQLEFFVNDLCKPDASTFVRLGSMEYKQNVDIKFPATNKVATDGLVLRGWYSAVTLAIYGVLAKTTDKERASPPPPPPPQVSARSTPQDHPGSKDYESPVSDQTITDWERGPRMSSISEPPPVRVHSSVEAPRFGDVPPMMHSQPESRAAYPADMPNVIGNFSEPPPAMVYQDCVPVPQVQPNAPPYAAYDAHYQKPWPPPEDQYQQPPEPYDRHMYNRPPDPNMYQQPPPESSRPMWDTKDRHGPPDIPAREHEGYNRNALLEIPPLLRDKDMSKDRNRERLWDRDMHDYKDDDRNRDHDSKRKDRGRRSRETSWERGSGDVDRYRDRDRDRDRMRDRDRDRDRNRDRSYMDRGVRKDVREPKRPSTPPSPKKARPHTPQTPPETERMVSGPRTPKEDEPSDNYGEPMEAENNNNFFETGQRERSSAERMYNLSEGEIQEEENTEEDDGYEEIVSEEEDMSDIEDRTIDMSEIDYDLNDESWNFMSSFLPYSCELTTFQYFPDPSLFLFEVSEANIEKDKDKKSSEESAAKAENVLESLNYPVDQEHDERWVELLEGINEDTLTILLGLKDQEKYKKIIQTLLKWVIEGLDFELSLKQPQTAYKVRHLKAGIRLSTMLFHTNEDIIKQLLEKNVPKLLLQLFNQPYMVLPVKLLILKGIDAATDTKMGIKYLLEKKFRFPKPVNFIGMKSSQDVPDTEETTCYNVLLSILVSKQLTRAVVTLSALLDKIHMHEILVELSDCVVKVIQGTQLHESKSRDGSPEITESSEPRAISVDPDLETVEELSTSGETHTQIIIACLQEATTYYRNAEKNLGFVKRYIPARSQFELPKSPSSPSPALLRLFKENNLIENMFIILSSPVLSGHPIVLNSCKDLLMEFLLSHEGMLFLLSFPDAINGIQRALLQTVDESREEGTDENVSQNLGLQIVFQLQALLYVDSLMVYHAKAGNKKGSNDSDAISSLHHMYTMVFAPFGRLAVVKVLTMADNLNSLLPFVQMSGNEAVDTKHSKSVCTGYVTELLMLVIHYSEDVLFLEKFSTPLYNLSQQGLTPKLRNLEFWTSPTRSIQNYNHEAVAPIMAVLTTHADDTSSLSPELITSLRILQHLTLPRVTDINNEQSQELKYMYSIIQVFSNNGMEIFKNILQNVCDTFLKPSHQSPALVGLQGVLVVAIVKPTISLMKSILAYIIACRGAEFKDLTNVPVLLNVFTLMLLIPPTSYSYNSAQKIQNEIIEALLSHTQPFIGSMESEEALSKSLWTEMLQEVLKYITLSPSNFVTGLTVLSELLPLPLPLQTREPLDEEEVIKMVNYRKLWSAHLHSLSAIIQEVIVSLAATSCHPLQQLLRRVCVQLADLAAPTALLIVRAVLDALMEALALPPPELKENVDPATVPTYTPTLKPPTSTTARILTLLAYLVSHASFKVPLLHVMKGSVKADEKYTDVLPLVLELFNIISEKTFVIQAQECIVSILQSFCDPDISFITFDSGAPFEEVLSSSLPCKEQLVQICDSLVQHIGTHRHNYSSVLPSLRSLVMLTEHDYGFYHVKQALEKHPGAVYSLFTRFSQTFSKDSSDFLSTLSTTLEFLRLMVNGFDDGAQTGRTILLSTNELADLLRANDQGSSKERGDTKGMRPFQPVVELEKQLTEFGNDEDAVESLLENISSLLSLLNSAAKKEKSEKEIVEPMLPVPESQSAQFASRAVFMVGDIEEGRLSPAYWLALPGAEDTDQEQEQVPVDLLTISEKNIPGEFNLKASLESLCLSNDMDDSKSKKKGIGVIGSKRKYSPLINPALVDVNNKRPFIAPMRGRGFSRATSHSSRANDPFRSRPPNTSRPPSMHVDDFLALESHHSGPNSQSQIKRPIKEVSRGRGSRGSFERSPVFTSTRGTTGRFFNPPSPYGRRDSNRGGNRGANRISSIGWNSRSNQNSSTGPGQRNNFGSHRSNYNSPFNQQDSRPVGQRNRDNYQSNNIPLGRFSRGSRTGSNMNQQNQGHWQDNRNKSEGQRLYW